MPRVTPTVEGARADWLKLANRIAADTAKRGSGAVAAAVTHLASVKFEPPEKARIEAQRLGRVAVRAAKGPDSSVEAACAEEGIDPRSFWRNFKEHFPAATSNEFRVVWHRIFMLGINKFGLKRRGYIVAIDEHMVAFWGKARKAKKKRNGMSVMEVRSEDAKLTQVGLLASRGEDGEVGLMMEFMVAYFPESGVVLPIEVFLTSTDGELLVDEALRVPGLQKGPIIKRHIDCLEAFYPVPMAIVFDKGYYSHDNYAYVSAYCKRRRCYYMTPAKNDGKGIIEDDFGTVHASIPEYVKLRCGQAKWVSKRTGVKFLVARRPIPGYPHVVRTLIVFLRPKVKGEDLPDGAVDYSRDYFAFAFYTNAPNPAPHIQQWERLYSWRWTAENFFLKRVQQMNGGRAHRIGRRLFIFMLGLVIMALFALARAWFIPRYDVKRVKHNGFLFPTWLRGFLKALRTS